VAVHFKIKINEFKILLEKEIANVFGLTVKNERKGPITYYDNYELNKRIKDEKTVGGEMRFATAVTESLSIIPKNNVDEILDRCRYSQFNSELQGLFLAYEDMQGKDIILINDKHIESDTDEIIAVILHETAHYLLKRLGYYDHLLEKVSQNLIALGIDVLSKLQTEAILIELVTDILVEKLLLEYENHSPEQTDEIKKYIKKTRKWISDHIEEWYSYIKKRSL
jgi:hypothetical protein